jgi:hypothetical protein
MATASLLAPLIAARVTATADDDGHLLVRPAGRSGIVDAGLPKAERNPAQSKWSAAGETTTVRPLHVGQ